MATAGVAGLSAKSHQARPARQFFFVCTIMDAVGQTAATVTHAVLRSSHLPVYPPQVDMSRVLRWSTQEAIAKRLNNTTFHKVTGGLGVLVAAHTVVAFLEDPNRINALTDWYAAMSKAIGTVGQAVDTVVRRVTRKKLYERVVEHLAPPPSSSANSVYVALSWFVSQWNTPASRLGGAGVGPGGAGTGDGGTSVDDVASTTSTKSTLTRNPGLRMTSESDSLSVFSEREMKAGSGVPDVQTAAPFSELQGICRNGVPIGYQRGHNTRATNIGDKVVNRDIYTITLRSEYLEAIEGFIKDVMEEYEQHLIEMSKKILFYTLQRGSSVSSPISWKSEPFNNQRRLDSIALPAGCDLLENISEFAANEKWYQTRGLPYKCVVLLHGPPGTGKSVTANAICNYLKRSKCNLTLQTLTSDQELFAARAAVDVRQVVFVIDDCDAHVNALLQRTDDLPKADRSSEDLTPAETVALAQAQAMQAMAVASMQKVGSGPASQAALMGGKTQTITLSGFLQFLDGQGADGMVVVMTTNMKDKLDRALWRSCRVDICLEMPAVTAEQVKTLYRLFYDGLELSDDNLPDLARYPELVSADIEAVFREFKFQPVQAAEALKRLVPPS